MSEIDELRAERDALIAQLPEGMKHCTILFKECEKGHGRLTATNWVQHGCPTCERDKLAAKLEEAMELLRRAPGAISVAYAQARAEYQGLDQAADRHDKFVMEYQELVRTALSRFTAEPAKEPAK